jgi:hypothetical protein
MWSILVRLLALLLLADVYAARAAAQPALPGPLRVQESRPVTVNGATFRLVAQTEWQPPTPNGSFPVVSPIDIQPRITNSGKKALLLETSKSFGLKVIDADGKEVKACSVGVEAARARPIVIPAGASYSLCRRADLRWDQSGLASELIYYDGTGAHSIIGPLSAGRYKLVFWYSVVDKPAKQAVCDATTWVGEALTSEVPIQLLNETTRGLPQERERVLNPVTEVIRIRESEPVTVNQATFVLAAESNWKTGGSVVPIDIQLRITNASRNELLFPTFDSIVLSVKDPAGRWIMPGAGSGRNATVFTRPVVLAPGASYAIGAESSVLYRRWAELHGHKETNAATLRYYDGTGWVGTYGPLVSGRYSLELWYGVSRNGSLSKIWEKQHRKPGLPPTWVGHATTSNLSVDILDR